MSSVPGLENRSSRPFPRRDGCSRSARASRTSPTCWRGSATRSGSSTRTTAPGTGRWSSSSTARSCPEVRFVRDRFSDGLAAIEAADFDCVYSISVLEHVDGDGLDAITRGMRRPPPVRRLDPRRRPRPSRAAAPRSTSSGCTRSRRAIRRLERELDATLARALRRHRDLLPLRGEPQPLARRHALRRVPDAGLRRRQRRLEARRATPPGSPTARRRQAQPPRDLVERRQPVLGQSPGPRRRLSACSRACAESSRRAALVEAVALLEALDELLDVGPRLPGALIGPVPLVADLPAARRRPRSSP